MRYVSIDIETSGLDPEKNKVLSIGAIIEDTENPLPFSEVPKFNVIVLQNEIVGSPRAIAMNYGIISSMGMYLEGNESEREQLRLFETGKYDGGYRYCEQEEVVKEFYWFLHDNGFAQVDNRYVEIKEGKTHPMINGATKPITINAAGKNFGTFDKLFLQQLPWWQKLIRVRQRILDPGILFVDWKTDESIPNLTVCKERAGIEGVVTHNALEDAWDVIELLRKRY